MTKQKNNSFFAVLKRLNPEHKFLICVAVALALAFICSFFLIRLSRVNGESMSPTLSDGDWILVSPVWYKKDSLNRGDIIVFKRKVLTNGHIIKRVVGLPGETIQIKDGCIYVNGSAIDDEFYLSDPEDDFGPLVVREGSYFVMGDNRSDSNDSRHWENPEVDFDEIFGKMVFDFK